MAGEAEKIEDYYAGLPSEGGFDSLCKMDIPNDLYGQTVLDIGCRRGQGVYKLSAAVGPQGRAIGVDWRADFIERAEQGAGRALQKNGFEQSNMKFVLAFPERLAEAGVESETANTVFLNGVLNLLYDPRSALKQVSWALKPGGRLICQTVLAATPRDEGVIEMARKIGNVVQAAPHRKTFASWLGSAGFDMTTFTNLGERRIGITAAVDERTEAPVVETDETASFVSCTIEVIKPDGHDYARDAIRKDISQFR